MVIKVNSLIRSNRRLTNMSKVLVEYIREFPVDERHEPFGSFFDDNFTKGKPIGCVVAISPTQIGYSFCCPKDQFCKQRGRSIAVGRAEKGTVTKVPSRIVDCLSDNSYNFKWITLKEVLDKKIEEMKERAKKYFK